MGNVWERKEKKAWAFLFRNPVTLFLVALNLLLFSWFGHILHVAFTDSPEHMSLVEWARHLVSLFT